LQTFDNKREGGEREKNPGSLLISRPPVGNRRRGGKGEKKEGSGSWSLNAGQVTPFPLPRVRRKRRIRKGVQRGKGRGVRLLFLGLEGGEERSRKERKEKEACDPTPPPNPGKKKKEGTEDLEGGGGEKEGARTSSPKRRKKETLTGIAQSPHALLHVRHRRGKRKKSRD